MYRSVRPIGPYSKIGIVPAGWSPAYSDTGLRARTTFYYVVTAVDASINQSHRSNEASAKTLTGTEEQASIGPRPAPLGVSTGHPRITSGTARFIGQIVLSPGTFSSGGDSGSLIVTEDGYHPVGLLFAGGDTYTVANPIDLVLRRFGVTVDGQ